MTDENFNADYENQELDQMLYAREAEIKSLEDLENQRGTTIPALFSTMYKFVQNPSSVSVETYKRMIDTDDTIGSGIDFLTTCLAGRLGEYSHPNKEVAAFVKKALKKVNGGWFNAVKELLSATWAGFAVQEKVWANDDQMGFIIKKLVSLPPTTMMFETERTGELTQDGILQYQRNWNPMLLGTGLGYYGGLLGVGFGFSPTGDSRPDPFAKLGDMPFPLRTNNSYSYLSIRIPKQKCVHYSFDAQGKFGNPYGRSLLRRIYKFYVLKDSILQMLAVALDRKGTPLTIVYADPNTTLADETKATAINNGGNIKGRRAGIRADEAARAVFSRIHNDSVMILPGKKGQIYEVEALPQGSNSGEFIQSLDFCNKSIMRGLLIPALMFGGDGGGSYSLGQEHTKTFMKVLDGMLDGLKEVLIQDVVTELIQYNYPRTVWEKDGFGDFSHAEFADEDLEKLSRIWETAINNGVIDTNELKDLNKMRGVMGFDERETPIEKQEKGGLFDGLDTADI